MAQYFDNDESGYLRWVMKHRDDGFIVNIGGGFLPKLHRSSRQCVTSPKRTNYTTHEYKKDCSTDRRELEKKYGSELTYCKVCFPESGSAS